MKILCYVTQAIITQRCTVKSCMWHSVANRAGCMAWPVVPEPESLNDAVLARHKGVTVAQIAKWKAAGSVKIEAAVILHQFFDWHKYKQKESLPYDDTKITPEVQNAVNKLCEQQWPYTIEALEWTPGRVAATVDANTVRRFILATSKQIDWLKALGISAQQQSSIAQIFQHKESSNENSRNNGKAVDNSASSKPKRAR